jgi:hypothetical protein
MILFFKSAPSSSTGKGCNGYAASVAAFQDNDLGRVVGFDDTNPVKLSDSRRATLR